MTGNQATGLTGNVTGDVTADVTGNKRSAFDDLDSHLQAVTQQVFAEDALLEPRVAQQYVEAAADADRMQIKLTGVFSIAPAVMGLKGHVEGRNMPGSTRIASAQAEFWVSAAEVQCAGFRPARGDRLVLCSRQGSPTYAISAVQEAGGGDLTLVLVVEDDQS